MGQYVVSLSLVWVRLWPLGECLIQCECFPVMMTHQDKQGDGVVVSDGLNEVDQQSRELIW